MGTKIMATLQFKQTNKICNVKLRKKNRRKKTEFAQNFLMMFFCYHRSQYTFLLPQFL